MNVSSFVVALALLAEASPPGTPVASWTDKEVLIAIGSVLGALIPVVLFILNFITRCRFVSTSGRHGITTVSSVAEPGR